MSLIVATSPQAAFAQRAPSFLVFLLIGSLTILPFLQPLHDLPITSFYSEWLAFALGLGACIALLSSTFWKQFAIPKTAVYLFAFIALIAIQNFVITDRIYPAQALLPALFIAWAMLLHILASWLKEQHGSEIISLVLAWGLMAGGIFQALVGSMQYLQVHGSLVFTHDLSATVVYGNLAQTNNFATYLTLATLALIYLFAQQRVRWIITAGLLGLFTFALALSGSRSVFLYLLATLLFSIASYWKGRSSTHVRLLSATVLSLIMFLVWQFILPMFDAYVGGLTALEKLREMSGISIRTSEWHKAWLMFLDSPLLGVGIGNYGWHSFLYQSTPEFAVITKDVLFAHSHNLFMQVLAELGITGLLLLIGLIVAWLRQYFREWLKPTHWLIGACLLVLFIHSNLEYPLWYSFFLGLAAFLLGLGEQRNIKLTFTPGLGQFATGVVLLIAVAILTITFAGYRQLANLNSLVFRAGPQQAARVVQGVAGNPLLRPSAEAIMVAHGAANKSTIERQLELATRVMRHHPDPINVRHQIRYLALADRTEDAVALLRQASLAYPGHVPNYICLWRTSPEEELQPIIVEAEKLLNKPLRCAEKGPLQSLSKVLHAGRQNR